MFVCCLAASSSRCRVQVACGAMRCGALLRGQPPGSSFYLLCTRPLSLAEDSSIHRRARRPSPVSRYLFGPLLRGTCRALVLQVLFTYQNKQRKALSSQPLLRSGRCAAANDCDLQ